MKDCPKRGHKVVDKVCQTCEERTKEGTCRLLDQKKNNKRTAKEGK